MTDPKQTAFLAEYKALCERHGLMFVANHGLLLEVMSVLHNGDPLEEVQPDDDGEFNASDWLALNQAMAELSKHLDAQPRLELRTGTPENPGPVVASMDFTPEERRSMQELSDAVDWMSAQMATIPNAPIYSLKELDHPRSGFAGDWLAWSQRMAEITRQASTVPLPNLSQAFPDKR